MPGRSLELNNDPQVDCFEALADISASLVDEESIYESCERKFIAPDREHIYLGHTKLDKHLKETRQTEPLIVAAFLSQLDWQTFEKRYAKTGRPAYAPSRMMGLILYGILQGKTSLRELEKLARLDLGCMWVTGGICPDHACIGNFIILHDTSLGDDLFKSLTRKVLRKTNSNGERVAGDGTVIEAAASRYKRLKEEAVKEQLEEAKKKRRKHQVS